MFHIKVSLFARTKSLENKIDLFHDKIIDAAMTFKKAIRVFLNEKRSENYRKLSKQIKTIEHDADALRRDIENKLYIQNLIPDLRADVLHLVENLDKIINKFDEVTYKFYIEQPDIPAEYHSRVIELCEPGFRLRRKHGHCLPCLFPRLQHRPRLFAESLLHRT